VWKNGTPDWTKLTEALRKARLPEGTRLVIGGEESETLRVVTYGKSAHSGMNLRGGRNALIALALALESKLPNGGANDLLAFARLAGHDPHGAGLGITDHDPVWGRYGINVATLKLDANDPAKTALTINLRRIPPRTAPQMKAHLEQVVARFNQSTGGSLAFGGYFEDEPFGQRTDAPLVRRLMRIYERATGEKGTKPAIAGGGTYAKKLPNAIAFGMWFPGKPYTGHDVDEKIAIPDLHRGARVLVHALADVATGEKIEKPF
jgi:succinyl-diaminopimelate desuccinylase